MEEKLKLTEKQEKEFMEKFKTGDIWGLKYLEDLIENEIKPKRKDINEDIYDLIDFVIQLNSMNSYGETFKGICAKHYDKINELYMIMKNELLNMFDNDFNKYWNN